MCRGGCEYSEKVLEYRETGNPVTKKSLPLVTVGCRLTGEKDAEKHPDPGTGYRVPEQIAECTGWIALDIDQQDNPHIPDACTLRDELKKIVFVAFAGLSTGGQGVWALVRVSNPNRQAEHFEQLQADFGSNGIKLDSTKGKNAHDARFYSYDPGAWVRGDFRVYDRLPKPKPKPRTIKRVSTGKDTRSAVETLIQEIQSRRIDITAGYDEWLRIGFAIADEFGESGREYFHAISQYHSEYSERETDRQYTNCIQARGSGVTIATFFHVCRQYGIEFKKDRRLETKYESDNSAPFGMNPYTGEIFDERGYPSDWDTVTPPEPGTPEYDEAERQVKLEMIQETFDTVPV